jgi:hypothetical protein
MPALDFALGYRRYDARAAKVLDIAVIEPFGHLAKSPAM